MIAEAKTNLPAVAAECRGATDYERSLILIRLSNLVGKTEVLRNGTDQEQAQYFADFHAILGHLPASVLERACLAYAAAPEGEFMPKPGKLLELAGRDEEWRAMTRVWRGLERLSMARPSKPPISADEEAEVTARWEALSRRITASVKADHRKVDEEAEAALDHFRRSAQAGRMKRVNSPEAA